LTSLHDNALGGNHTDLALRSLRSSNFRADGIEIRIVSDLVIALSFGVFADHFNELPTNLIPAFQCIDQSALQGQAGGIPVDLPQALLRLIRQALDAVGVEAPQARDIGFVSLPKNLQPGLVGFAGGGGHAIAGQRLQCGFVFSDPEEVHGYPQFVQRRLEIVTVDSIALDPDLPHRVKVEPVGMRRQVIAVLVVGIAGGDDFLATVPETLQGPADFLQLTESGRPQLIQLQHHSPDAGILGGTVDGVDYVLEWDLLPAHGSVKAVQQ